MVLVDGTPRRRERPCAVVVGYAWRFGGGERRHDCEWCGVSWCELAMTRGGTAAPPAPRDFLLCRAVVVQIGWDSSGESLAGFLLVMMTTASEDVVLLVGGVILELISFCAGFSG